MQVPASVRPFLLGLAVSVVLLISFFAGGLADRVFVIKPLDWISPRTGSNLGKGTTSSLGQLIDTGHPLTIPDVVAAASQSVVTVSIKKQQRVLSPSVNSLFGFNLARQSSMRLSVISAQALLLAPI
ncbi:MAG: hypothetical protein O2840_03580 [bacterium]|nr:hypothetical protein [bacterium]